MGVPFRKKIKFFWYIFLVCLCIATVFFTIPVIQAKFQAEAVAVSGTGSMVPTFPKDLETSVQMLPYPLGITILGKRFFGITLAHGDIVAVENKTIQAVNKTTTGKEAGWIKRIIGLPGDRLEIRDGNMYRNNTIINEPYVAKPQSTFGARYLGECKQITVPDDFIFVMGDNRKSSLDSREIGFVEISAIHHVMPYYHDETVPKQSQATFDQERYLSLLNQKRREAGVGELAHEPKLATSAAKRGTVILADNDFSPEATKSGYSVSKAFKEIGYKNIRWGEAPVLGYFDAEELIENQLAFPNSKTFLLDPGVSEIGIAVVSGAINNCPTQIIVQHVVGHLSQKNIQSLLQTWKTTLSDLKKKQSYWQNQEKNNDVDQILTIIATRIKNLTTVVKRLERYERLTPAEQILADIDETLAQELQALTEKLAGT